MGVRVDYSGRSVITVDPTMSVDTIGIPEDMAPKLMELTCLGEMETESFNKDGLLRRKAAFKQKAIEILNRSFIVPGRQPTLYKHGLQAFRVKVVKGNAIVLNPLTCPSFNADFDGDQMHVITPIGEGAIKDVEHLMLNTKNLFYSTTVPTAKRSRCTAPTSSAAGCTTTPLRASWKIWSAASARPTASG